MIPDCIYEVHTHWGWFLLDEGAYTDYLDGKLWITWVPGKPQRVIDTPAAPGNVTGEALRLREMAARSNAYDVCCHLFCGRTVGIPYYVDKKKKEYLPPSEAEARGLERADKHPKSTKFGRQNPITERWNSDEQLVLWRSAWADTVNRALEHSEIEERIDHRSHAERGLDEQPTVHEGVEAQAMERKGFVSDRCELNHQPCSQQIAANENGFWRTN